MSLMDLRAQFELNRLVHASGRYLDERDFQAYLDLYLEEGSYEIVTRAPELPEPMVWMRYQRHELRARIAALSEQEWEIAQVEQSRVLSVEVLEPGDGTARTSSSFLLYHTSPEGITSFYAAGRYDDCWETAADTWKLRSRRVVLKTRQLGMPSPLPI